MLKIVFRPKFLFCNIGLRLLIDTRVRKGPYWHLSQEQGAWCYQIYNKVYHPRAYVRPEDGGLWKEYESLTKDVTMWNVAVERQICVKGTILHDFYVLTRNFHRFRIFFTTKRHKIVSNLIFR